MIQNYLGKISRPVLDRIDIQVEMPQLSYEEISSAKKGEPSSAVLERIMKAREIQQKRFAGTEIRSNSKIPPSYLHEMCPMDENAKQMLSDCFDKMGLSARAYDRILKVARTCADIAGSKIQEILGRREITVILPLIIFIIYSVVKYLTNRPRFYRRRVIKMPKFFCRLDKNEIKMLK